MMRPHLLLMTIALTAMTAGAAENAAIRDEMGRDYYLYEPSRIDARKTYWLVVGVHGYGGNGKGAAGLAGWVRNGDCIVVGPSFPNDGYQLLQKQADEQLVRLFESLQKQFKLRPKLFVYGFSGGSQFAHRFMMKYPELVAGCSAHSGGTWATGDQWMSINPKAAAIPFVMSCGEADTAKSNPAAPFGRYEWARVFEKQIAEAGFCYEAKYWPKVGHATAPGVSTMTEDCYRLATVVQPAIEAAIDDARKRHAEGNTASARTVIAKARSLLPKPTTELSRRFADQWNKVLTTIESDVGTAAKPVQ
ncbi:alpha/beta hydrolase [Humisphaera borealis]|uniref:Alpha/beta hydrolase n=1 Tax=Humisphaera borealis TaxID=2807512 RepID=A0A7M2X025_9BACT|nr:alpha/beta hydrolase [Humisphaera borealis]QOV90441.1 alpha/beta hydrolase [Humisphaera borealis]